MAGMTRTLMGAGWLNGLTGVIIFSGSLPATKVALADLEPYFLTFSRASIAGILALCLMLSFRQKWPSSRQVYSIIVISLGVVIGFPLLTALAMQSSTSAHSVVFIGLLPLSTAIFAVIRAGERPRPIFWFFSLLGSVLIIGFMMISGILLSLQSDLLMLAAIGICGLGYAEGAKLSRQLGGWQVICWALVISMPLMLPAAFLTQPETYNTISLSGWLALGYVSVFSMLIGFIFWYRGLVQGGIAAVGQLQLLQPFIALMLCALLLNETVTPLMIAITAGIMACIIGSRRYA